MFKFLQNIIEALYLYKLSWYYHLHFLLIVLLALLIIWLFYCEKSIRSHEENPPSKQFSTHLNYFDYVTTKQKTTDQAVRKLQQSKQYRQYLAQKNDPYSKLNSRHSQPLDQDDEIVLSDDSDEQATKTK